ncbi:MAG: hypothetical protein SNJ64_00830, partial [Endomicrobiia bacterium]
MNSLVLFYTRSGTTKVVATKIAEILNCDIEEVVDCKNRDGILGWLSSGRDAFRKYLTTIKPIAKDLSSYEHIIIGTPVWAGNVTPAIRTVVKNYCDKFNKVTFFCTMGITGDKKVFAELELLCKQKPVSKLAINRSEVISGEYVKKIKI